MRAFPLAFDRFRSPLGLVRSAGERSAGARARRPAPAWFALLVTAGLALSGCATGTQQSPNDTLRAYAKALRERRVEDAYALLATDARRSIPLEAFRRMVLESPADVDEIALALSRPASDPIVTASVTTPAGDEVLLVYEHGRWRVDGQSLDLYAQGTPKQAVRAFLRAFDRKRFDILMRFVPEAKRVESQGFPALDEDKLRASWEGPQREDMQRITLGIKAALPEATIEETNDRATMVYGAGGTLSLVREHGAWKIEDFD